MHVDWILTTDGRKLVEFESKEKYDELIELCDNLAINLKRSAHEDNVLAREALDEYKRFKDNS